MPGHVNLICGRRARAIFRGAQWIGDVFDDMKRANGVILPGMRSGMLCDRFVSNIGSLGHWGKNRIKPDIGCMGQMTRQPAFTAADIKNLISRLDQFGGAPEFRPRKAGRGQYPVEVAFPV
jgi:hypothetical protein